MNRYQITNLITGQAYNHEGDADSLAEYLTSHSPDRVKPIGSCGHPERRFPTTGQGWSIEQGADGLEHVTAAVDAVTYTDMEGIEQQTDPVPEIRRPLQEVRPEWYRVAAPVLDGVEVVVQAEHSIETVSMLPELKAAKEAALWTASTNYEQIFVANAAYSGLLEAKLAGSPKAIAFGNWITTLWAEYYSRKDALLAATTQAEIEAIGEDFSSVGEPPYTIRDVLFGV